MNGKEVFIEIMEAEKYNQSIIADYVDGGKRQSLWQQIAKSDDLKVNRFVELLGAMGYELKLEKVGYVRISREYMNRLIDGMPRLQRKVQRVVKRNALFYTDEGGFTVYDNREDGQGLVGDFPNENDMKDWLNKASGKTRTESYLKAIERKENEENMP